MSSLHPYVRAALDEIKAAPDDATPRLMLADWLEENGDEADHDRAQVLRLGCQAAARPRWDMRRFVEEAQARALLHKHRDAWLGDIPTSAVRLSRGLLHLRIDGAAPRWLSTAAAPTVRPWVGGIDYAVHQSVAGAFAEREHRHLADLLDDARALTYPGGHIHDHAQYLDHGDTARLTTLHVGGWPGADAVRGLLARPLDSLQDLTLPDADPTLLTWPRLRQLRRLTLNGPQCALRALPGGEWPHLEELSGHDLYVGSFARGDDWPRLRHLSLRRGVNRLPAALAASSLLGRLESLTLSEIAHLSAGGLRVLAAAPRLRRLSLSLVPLAAPEWASLLATTAFPALTDLALFSLPLALESFPAASLFDRLDSLTLSNCSLTAPFLAGLAGSPALGRLRHLAIGHCDQIKEFLRPLCARTEPTSLTDLDLRYNYWSSSWPLVRELSAGVLPHLTGLGLIQTNYTAADLIAWPLLARLQALDLSDTQLSEDDLRTLLASPRLAVAWIRVPDRGLSPDFVAASRDRFGPDNLPDINIPF